jgi:hypothetical protein
MRDAGGMKTGNLARAPGEYTTQEARRTRQDAGTHGAGVGRAYGAGGPAHETRRGDPWRGRWASTQRRRPGARNKTRGPLARALGEYTAQEARCTRQDARALGASAGRAWRGRWASARRRRQSARRRRQSVRRRRQNVRMASGDRA